MEIVERILGTYIPLCCLSLPVLGFFALAAALPVAFFAMTGQRAKEQGAGSRRREEEIEDQGAQSGE
jgi:hypothetical protein